MSASPGDARLGRRIPGADSQASSPRGVVALALAALALSACSELPVGSPSCDPAPEDVICVDDARLTVEVAETPQERETGLSGRPTLAADHGMLFVFPFAGRHGFWMKDTTIPLSIAFVDSSGVIRQIEELEPLSEDVVAPAVPVPLALEVNRGWFGDHGVRPGDTIRGGATF